jgi:2Fe-2S ferredoxin
VPRVSFQPSGRTVEVPAGSTLLDAAVSAGLPIARACGADGLCGRCGLRILAGAETGIGVESDLEAAARRRNRLDPTLRLACRARVHGDVEVTAAYW